MGCVFSQEQDERKHHKDRRHPSQQQQQPQKQIRPQQQQQQQPQKQQIQQVNGNRRSAENGTQIKLQTGIKTTIIAGKPKLAFTSLFDYIFCLSRAVFLNRGSAEP
jgi:hypothetical protein